MYQIKGIIHYTELGEMKDEIPNDNTVEACFLDARAYC